MFKAICVIFTLSFLAGCGGSSNSSTNNNGGGSPPVVVPTTYNLEKLNSTNLGSVYYAELSGTDSNGGPLTGTISLVNRAEGTLNGLLVTPRDGFSSITLAGSDLPLLSALSTTYIETSTGNIQSVYVETTDVYCVSESPQHMPSSVKVGDFGSMGVLICDNDTTINGTWSAENATNGNVRFVINTTAKGSFDEAINNTGTAYTLNPNGDILSISLTILFYPSGYTVTLSGV